MKKLIRNFNKRNKNCKFKKTRKLKNKKNQCKKD